MFFAEYFNKTDFKINILNQGLKNIEKEYYILHFRGDDFIKQRTHSTKFRLL